MVRHNNQLPHNLPQLQNLIKRDPSSYAEEYKEQYEHFCGLLEIFALNPSSENHSLEEVVMFIAQVGISLKITTDCIMKLLIHRYYNAIPMTAKIIHKKL